MADAALETSAWLFAPAGEDCAAWLNPAKHDKAATTAKHRANPGMLPDW